MGVPFALADMATGALRLLEAEAAHTLTLAMLKTGLAPTYPANQFAQLAITVAGIDFPNPLGLAAGFDKNAQAADALLGLGFGFVELGAVTPLPQPGNDRPRVFRLRNNRAVINRYGFNNDGLEAIEARLAARIARPGIVGINLGANKLSDNKALDYVTCFRRLAGKVSFATINISSPNTPGLRSLQGRDELEHLLDLVLQEKANHPCPVFLKIAPDLADEAKADIAEIVISKKIDALIVSNTTLARPSNLDPKYAGEAGGLSGAPLFRPSTTALKEFAQLLKGAVPLIGVGGIFSARDAYAKILNGASLVQLYTGLIYQGPGLVRDIVRDLPSFLQADGFTKIEQAVGQAL